MKKLLSLPPNLVECFHDIMHADHKEWFCTSDPVGKKLGSGGGTAWLLNACREEEDKDAALGDWLAREKRILLHAGGQSRRLPGYAPSGKVLTPIPVFRWARGQRITQDLLSLQLPLYEEIMERAPEGLRTLIASGDVYIRATEPLQEIPDVDVVCYGLWVDPELAKNHGVFVSSRKEPEKLDFMLQKPSVEEMGQLMQDYLFLMDIGIWLLSDRAIELMVKRSTDKDGGVKFYDMYSEFGLALGAHPRIVDEELNSLKVAILPLPGGEFHHYGTSREMISSTLAVQNCVTDQRAIMHHKVKPHPAVFVQNAEMEFPLTADNAEVWVENSHVGKSWTLHSRNIITGVPRNDWALNVPEGVCIDVVPMGEREFAARPYGFNDKFKGSLKETSTAYLGRPVTEWLAERGLTADEIRGCEDLQSAAIFPVTDSIEDLGTVLQWMTDGGQGEAGRAIWQKARKVSADEISAYANLRRLFAQREVFRKENWSLLAKNQERSVFYQVDLQEAAEAFAKGGIALPEELPEGTSLLKRISDAMFRAKVRELEGNPEAKELEARAFGLMRQGLTSTMDYRQQRIQQEVIGVLPHAVAERVYQNPQAEVASWNEVAELLEKDSLMETAGFIRKVVRELPDQMNRQGQRIKASKDYRTVIVPYLEQLRQVKYLCRYDIYREPTDKEVMAAYRRKGLNGMYTRYEYWKLLQLLKDSQEKEAVARKAYEESLSMKRPWVLAGNTLAKLYLEKDVTDTQILEPLIDRTIFTVNYERKNMDTGRTEIINPIEVVVNQLCTYIKAGDFENASVMAKLIPEDYKEFDLVKAYAWAMGGYFQGGNTPEETQRATETFRTICQSSVQNEAVMNLALETPQGNAQADKALEQMADESPVKWYLKAVTEARKGDVGLTEAALYLVRCFNLDQKMIVTAQNDGEFTKEIVETALEMYKNQ